MTEDEVIAMEKLLKKADKNPNANQWEKDFTASQQERFLQYADRTLFSEKQIACLKKIANKTADKADTAKGKPKAAKAAPEEDDDEIPF